MVDPPASAVAQDGVLKVAGGDEQPVQSPQSAVNVDIKGSSEKFDLARGHKGSEKAHKVWHLRCRKRSKHAQIHLSVIHDATRDMSSIDGIFGRE